MSLKLKPQQLIDLLKLAGVQVAVADDAPDQNLDEVLAQIDTNRLEVLKPRIEAEIRPEIEQAAQGQITGSLRALLNQHTNAGQVAFKDLPMKDMVKKAFDIYKETFGQDAEGVRGELQTMQQTHQAALADWETKYNNDIQTEKQKYIDRDINENLFGVINKIPRVGGDPLEQTKAFRQHLASVAHVHYDENGKAISLRTLDNKEVPLQNKEKTRNVEVEELAKEWAGKVGILKTDTRHESTAQHMQQVFQPANMERGRETANETQQEIARLTA